MGTEIGAGALGFDASIQGRWRWFSLVFSILTSVLLQLCDGLVNKDRAPLNFIAAEAKQAASNGRRIRGMRRRTRTTTSPYRIRSHWVQDICKPALAAAQFRGNQSPQ
jgi:hypothetical protein